MDQAETLRQRMGSGIGRPPLRVIAVTSGKGGVGKTNIATNLAVLAARMGRRVLVMDADLGLANVEIVLGLKPRHHIGDLIDGRAPLDEVLARGPHGIRILGAGSGVQSLTSLDDARKMRLIEALDPLDEMFDVVIVDTGAGIGDNVLFFVGAAQEALLVVNPEPTSLTDAYATVKVLSQQAGVRDFDLLVNPAPHELAARDIYRKLTRVTDKFLDVNVKLVGHVPYDDNLQRSVMAQKPLVELYPLSPASRALAGIADKLLAGPPPRRLEGGLRLMWHRLLRDQQSLRA